MANKSKLPVKESDTIELKERPVKLEKDISAFANTKGGSIFIGITDDGRVIPTKLSNRLHSQIVNSINVCEPRPLFQLDEHDDIIELKIFEGRFKPYKAPDGFYIRLGATSQKLSRDEIIQFFHRANAVHFDEQICATISDKELAQYLNLDLVRWFTEQSGLQKYSTIQSLLSNLALIERKGDRALDLTSGAILLFSDHVQDFFPQLKTVLFLMGGPSQILDQRIIVGNLFQQLQDSLNFIKSHLRTAFAIKALRREEVPEFSDEIIRELLLNALIHRDYFETGAEAQIKIFPGYLEFSNPGRLLQALTPATIFGKSIRRNPLLAEAMQRIGYIEKAGTGLLRVSDYLKNHQLPPLEIKEIGPFFVVKLLRPKIDLHQELPTVAEFDFTDSELAIVNILRQSVSPLSSSQIAERINYSGRTVRQGIKRLVELKLLAREKRGRNLKYRLSNLIQAAVVTFPLDR